VTVAHPNPAVQAPAVARCHDLGMPPLIAIDEARRRVLEAARPLPRERVALEDALGRVLAEEVRSDTSVPPFDSSAMDGFALVAGPPAELRVVDESKAGHPAGVRLEPGTAIRISTGAQIPEGATAVVPIERVETADGAVRAPETAPGENIRRAGEDVRTGELVLRPGADLGPAELAVLASLGRDTVICTRRPRLALVVTGDELVDPGRPLGPGRIWSSNPYALRAQATQAGAEVVAADHIPDLAEAIREAVAGALAAAEVVCVSGGVSVGPHDHVKDALRSLGIEERFWGVALKPGKPTWFGTREREGESALAFGLPGNPVSAMVTFQLFVRPALRRLLGADPEATRGTAVLDEPLARTPKREQAVRCRLLAGPEGWHAAPTGDQGSHVLTSMLGADALALVPVGDGQLAAGEPVKIELLR
jgi:molybdopterin molybdotransferase